MDPHCSRKLKLNLLWVFNLGNGKWPNKPKGLLTSLHPKGHIVGREPDSQANQVCVRSLAILVCSSKISVGRLEEGRVSIVPGSWWWQMMVRTEGQATSVFWWAKSGGCFVVAHWKGGDQ